MFPASTHKGQAVLSFPDVCKTPSPTAPVPMPYPTMHTATKPATKPANTKPSSDTVMLRNQLNILHQKLMTMPAGNASGWHAVLDDYVQTSAKLYMQLSAR